ncbi:hypothetical protein LX36DRAFT_329393 [Colletotrichum falcatum]|nr:hypothetical protein LX36DRAFT_329393 [Colletotrichum falcatum]
MGACSPTRNGFRSGQLVEMPTRGHSSSSLLTGRYDACISDAWSPHDGTRRAHPPRGRLLHIVARVPCTEPESFTHPRPRPRPLPQVQWAKSKETGGEGGIDFLPLCQGVQSKRGRPGIVPGILSFGAEYGYFAPLRTLSIEWTGRLVNCPVTPDRD